MKFLNQVTQGDCLELMAQLPDSSVDMVLCDLPYGTTRNKWDAVVDLAGLWEQYRRVLNPRGAVVLTAQSPFSVSLGASNIEWLKYEWIWEKNRGTGHLNANFAPLKSHEQILVFSPAAASQVKHHEDAMIYNPQKVAGVPYTRVNGKRPTETYDSKWQRRNETISNGERYPTSLLYFPMERGLHPTQKPVALFEYLIRTYTNPGDVVLDCCCGSGTTGVAARNTGRQFIQFELSAEYCEIARRRLAECEMSEPLFLAMQA